MTARSVRAGNLVASAGIWLAATLLAGCAPLNVPRAMPWADQHPEPGMPSRMTVVWSDTTLHQPGQLPVRGFGGRILFYADRQEDPIVVDGTLNVYAFDETDQSSARLAPERKYVITADQLPKHYSDSKVGHSYNVWVPWDAGSSQTRQISLVIRFDGQKGGMVLSEHTRHLLPGTDIPLGRMTSARPDWRSLSPTDAGGVVPASYRTDHMENVGSSASAARTANLPKTTGESMSTVTIDVPASFVQQQIMAEGALAGLQAANAAGLANQPGETTSSPGSTGHQPANSAQRSDLISGSVWNRTTQSANSAPAAEDPASVRQQQARFARPRFPAQERPSTRPRFGRPRREPLPATWPSRLPETPRSDQTGVLRSLPSTAQTDPR